MARPLNDVATGSRTVEQARSYYAATMQRFARSNQMDPYMQRIQFQITSWGVAHNQTCAGIVKLTSFWLNSSQRGRPLPVVMRSSGNNSGLHQDIEGLADAGASLTR